MSYTSVFSLILLLVCFLQPTSVIAVDLEREATIQRLITSFEINDYEKAYEIIQGLKQSGVEIKGELLYYESLAALSTKRDFEAFDLAEQYIEQNGREAKHYDGAMQVYSAAGENADHRLAVNVIDYFSKTALELYIENRKTSLYNEFFESKVNEYEVFNEAHKDNQDGTISIYRVAQNQSGNYDLYKWEMFACPLGQTYRNGTCEGDKRNFEQIGGSNGARAVVENLSFAGHDDWQIPGEPNRLFFINPIELTFDGQRYGAARDVVNHEVPHYLPQAFLFNTDTRDRAISKLRETASPSSETARYQIPFIYYLFKHGDGYGPEYCVYVSRLDIDCDSYKNHLLPVRGPELIKSNLEPRCNDKYWGQKRVDDFICLSDNGAEGWFIKTLQSPSSFSVSTLNSVSREKFKISESVSSGVLVTEVRPGSPAQAAGLKTGDVILELNGQSVQSAEAFPNTYRTTNDDIVLLISRRGNKMFLTGSKGWSPAVDKL